MISLTTRCGNSDTVCCAFFVALAVLTSSFSSAQESNSQTTTRSSDVKPMISVIEPTDRNQVAIQPAEQSEGLPTPSASRESAGSVKIDVLPPQDTVDQPRTTPARHAAFSAKRIVASPAVIIDSAPPKSLNDYRPESRPALNDVQWINGYWNWERDQNEFVWVDGLWMIVPPTQEWTDGYWAPAGSGYQWNSGYWSKVQGLTVLRQQQLDIAKQDNQIMRAELERLERYRQGQIDTAYQEGIQRAKDDQRSELERLRKASELAHSRHSFQNPGPGFHRDNSLGGTELSANRIREQVYRARDERNRIPIEPLTTEQRRLKDQRDQIQRNREKFALSQSRKQRLDDVYAKLARDKKNRQDQARQSRDNEQLASQQQSEQTQRNAQQNQIRADQERAARAQSDQDRRASQLADQAREQSQRDARARSQDQQKQSRARDEQRRRTESERQQRRQEQEDRRNRK